MVVLYYYICTSCEELSHKAINKGNLDVFLITAEVTLDILSRTDRGPVLRTVHRRHTAGINIILPANKDTILGTSPKLVFILLDPRQLRLTEAGIRNRRLGRLVSRGRWARQLPRLAVASCRGTGTRWGDWLALAHPIEERLDGWDATTENDQGELDFGPDVHVVDAPGEVDTATEEVQLLGFDCCSDTCTESR